MIGNDGLTAAVLREIDVALRAHELIKIRVFSDDRTAREDLLARICGAVAAAPVQHIGKLLVVFRPEPEPEPEAPPKPERAPSATKRRRPTTTTTRGVQKGRSPAPMGETRRRRRPQT